MRNSIGGCLNHIPEIEIEFCDKISNYLGHLRFGRERLFSEFLIYLQ